MGGWVGAREVENGVDGIFGEAIANTSSELISNLYMCNLPLNYELLFDDKETTMGTRAVEGPTCSSSLAPSTSDHSR